MSGSTGITGVEGEDQLRANAVWSKDIESIFVVLLVNFTIVRVSQFMTTNK
jgi:hypothetical protein